jgi:hypothetical protein
MRKIFQLVILLLALSFIFIRGVFAHPGRTDAKGCHTCKTNCESWGLSYGEYHCHNGSIKEVVKEAKNTAKIEAKNIAKIESK